MSTKIKILEAALKLFNEGNTQAATTNHIAAAAGISPGNLHYHYKNREAIIYTLYEQMHAELTADVPQSPQCAVELAQWHEHLFAVQWKYRFFFRELLYLLSRDPDLKARYQADTRTYKLTIYNMLQQLQLHGVLQLRADNILDYLSDMILMIGQFWSAYMQLCDAERSQVDARTGILRIQETLRPYLSPAALKELATFESTLSHQGEYHV